MKKHQIKIQQDLCIGCGLCAKDCCTHNIKIEQNKAHILLDECLMCGHCVAICPKEAISICGYEEQPIEQKQKAVLPPEDLLDVLRFRRSIRQFKQTDIPHFVIEQILEAGRLTHTAKHKEDVSFVVLDQEKNRMEQLAVSLFRKLKPFINLVSPIARNNKIHEHFFFFQAPIVIVIFAKDKTNGILAAQNMEFMAEAHGLGVLYSGYFTTAVNVSPKLKKAMKVEKGKKAAMSLVLGYPNVKHLRSTQHEPLSVTYL